MQENLLYVPFRRTESVKLSTGLKQCIESDYNQHPDRFSRDLAEIDRLREQIVNVDVDERSLQALYGYNTQLAAVSHKFPSDIHTELAWYNTLGYASNAVVKYSTLLFDQINVLYNIAALYSQLGFKQPKDQQDGMKRAYNYFQQAAGVYKYMADEILPLSETSLPMGLDAATIDTLQAVMLAQAQECLWQKAVADMMRDSIVAKLAAQVSDFYNQAEQTASRSNSIRSEWTHHVACKKWHFQAASEYRMSVDCLNRSKYGEEVARLKETIKACKAGLMNGKYVSGIVLENIQGLNNKAQSDLERAEKDNDLIYVQSVPQASKLPVIARGAAMSTPVVPKQLLEISQHALFADILPYAVYQAARLYAEQLTAWIDKNIGDKINKYITQIHDRLAQLQLPGSLDAVEKPLGIPQMLLTCSQEVKARGGISTLHETIKDVSNLSTEAQRLIKEAMDTLDVEEREDEMMRTRQGTDRWNRAPSREAAVDLWKRRENYQGYLETAAKSDNLVLNKFKNVEQLLKVVEQGKGAIERFVPNTTVVQLDRHVQKIISELREALSRARSLEVYWQQRLSQLKSVVANQDLFPAMEAHYRAHAGRTEEKIDASMFEPVLQQVLKKYQPDLDWVDDQNKQMEEVMAEIQQANARFKQSGNADSTTQHRQQAIQSLEQATSRFTEIQGNLEEGRKFYNNMLDQLKKYLSDCKQFVYERRVEGRNLEIEIRTSADQQHQMPQTEELESATPVAPTPLPAPRPERPASRQTWTPDQGIKFG